MHPYVTKVGVYVTKLHIIGYKKKSKLEDKIEQGWKFRQDMEQRTGSNWSAPLAIYFTDHNNELLDTGKQVIYFKRNQNLVECPPEE